MIRGGGSHRLEIFSSLLQGLQVTIPSKSVFSCHFSQLFNIFSEALKLRINHWIWTEGGNDLTLPA